MYTVDFTENARKQLIELNKRAPKAMGKLIQLLSELEEHPRSGTGQAERLKHFSVETWSRRITREHRLVYEIHEDRILVIVLSVFGHY